MTLFEISEQYQSILAEIDFLHSQLSNGNLVVIETQIAKLMNDLESIDSGLDSKLVNYRAIIKTKENDNKFIDLEIKRLKKRKQQNINLIEGLKNNIMCQFKELGKTRYETPLYTISIKKNPQKVVITDEHLIPKKYKEEIVTTKIHKDEIKKHLKLNVEIDGCELIQEKRVDIT